MSAIYSLETWYEIADRHTDGEMVYDILASWKMEVSTLRSRVEKLEAVIRAQKEALGDKFFNNCMQQMSTEELKRELQKQFEYNKSAHAANEHNLELIKVKDEGLATLYKRVEELMDSNHKWQEKCADLEQDNTRLREMVRWRNYPKEKPEKAGKYWCEMNSPFTDDRKWCDIRYHHENLGWNTVGEQVLRWTYLPEPPEVE